MYRTVPVPVPYDTGTVQLYIKIGTVQRYRTYRTVPKKCFFITTVRYRTVVYFYEYLYDNNKKV